MTKGLLVILITGGLGFIGAHTTRVLLAAGESCVVLSRREPTVPVDLEPHLGKNLFTVLGDVSDVERLRDVAVGHSVDRILHLAFGSPMPPSSDPVADVATGIGSLLGVLRVALERGVQRVGIASTIGVYGGINLRGPAQEDLPLSLAATHPIPSMKKLGELVSNQIAAASGLSVFNARIAGVWGPGGRPDTRFFGAPQLIHAAAADREPEFGALLAPPQRDDGIDLIYAPDCGDALARLLLAPTLAHAVYNVGSGRETTYGQLALAIEEIVPGFFPSLAPGRSTSATVLDISRLRADTAFEPQWNTETAVRDYLHWLRAGNER
jgi:UDP-glucose 4-epimerase